MIYITILWQTLELPGRDKGPCYDVTEDLDSSVVLELAVAASKAA